jgi:hypothetical protein
VVARRTLSKLVSSRTLLSLAGCINNPASWIPSKCAGMLPGRYGSVLRMFPRSRTVWKRVCVCVCERERERFDGGLRAAYLAADGLVSR